MFKKLENEDTVMYHTFYSNVNADIIIFQSVFDDLYELTHTIIISNINF